MYYPSVAGSVVMPSYPGTVASVPAYGYARPAYYGHAAPMYPGVMPGYAAPMSPMAPAMVMGGMPMGGMPMMQSPTVIVHGRRRRRYFSRYY